MAATGTRYWTPDQFEVDGNGVPLAAGQLWFFLTGTSSLKDTFSDVNLTTANANPIIADGNGRFGSIFLAPDAAYKVRLFTAATIANPTGSEIWTFDPAGPAAGGAIANTAGIVGEIRAFAGLDSAVPAGWYLPYGQAVSRSTYAAAYAVMGTSWGAGDGSTTFNLPDLRGRGLFGVDNMGGTAANRITSGVSGLSGASLGAAGGSQLAQRDTITAASTSTPTVAPHHHSLTSAKPSSSYAPNFYGGTGFFYQTPQSLDTTDVTVGITVATTTTATSSLTGTSQNIPPAAMVNFLIYLGA